MALCPNGRASLFSFMLGSSLCLIPCFSFINLVVSYVVEDWLLELLAAHAVVHNVVILFIYKGPSSHSYQVAVRGGFLGTAFGIGILLSFWIDSSLTTFGWYVASLAFFHWSEYFSTAFTNPSSLSLDSYLLDHSTEYKIAAMASWVEFTIELFLLPEMKHLRWVSLVGMVLVLFGEVLRKAAMFTAMSNFNHYVQYAKEEGHVLVTHGVYRLCRHPSYVGWFYWSIGTQLVLCNPLCLIGYTLASWKFFKDRIEAEEITLLNFFGEEYLEYQKSVRTGVPFIYGYRMEL